MKTKLSHVTNSSSVSFVGFGIEFDKGNKISDKLMENIKTACKGKSYFSDNEITDDNIYKHPGDFIEEVIPADFSLVYCEYSGCYIGGEYEKMPEDMTKRQFHEYIKKTLEGLGFDVSHIGVISEAWRDG